MAKKKKSKSDRLNITEARVKIETPTVTVLKPVKTKHGVEYLVEEEQTGKRVYLNKNQIANDLKLFQTVI